MTPSPFPDASFGSCNSQGYRQAEYRFKRSLLPAILPKTHKRIKMEPGIVIELDTNDDAHEIIVID